MKKVLYFGIAAFAALSFSSCQKEVAVEENNNLVTVTLRAEKAGIDTRTEAVEEEKLVSLKWTEEDKDNLKLFVVGKDANNNETFTEVERVVNISSDYKTLTVTATVEESSTLRAVVAGDWTSSNKPKVNVNQSPKTNNFDPNADILVADDVTVDGLNEKLLTFRRPITINKMTLKNMVAGEKVNEITISSEQHLTGYYENGKMTGQYTKITLSYDNVEVGSDGLFPVYFVAVPKEGHQLTVVVKTDQFTYTKTLGPVNFTVGKFSTFSTKLPAGTPVEDTDYTGDWVITGVNNGAFFAAQAYGGGNNLTALGITLDTENNKIVSSKVDEIKMHFEKVAEGDYAGLYTIKDNSGYYLYAASSSANQLKGNTTLGGNDYYWSVEEEADGTFTIKAPKSTNRNVMQFNSGNSLFSCYESAKEKPVTLYDFSMVVEATAQPSGTGTVDDPYNAVAAINVASELTWTSTSVYDVTSDVFVKGKISRIANNGTYTAGGTYGNASFYISEDGTTANEFYCFRILYLGNKKFASGQTDIKVGDDVVICGQLMNYQNNTPETVSGKAYLYSLNGDTGEAEEYDITIADCENGSVVPNVDTAAEGDEVTLTITPDTGYELDAISVVTDAGDPVTVNGKKFIMPAAEVIVTVTFKEKTTPVGDYYVKVTENLTDWTEGSYLIVNEDYGVAITGSGTTAAEVKAPSSVTITSDGIEATDEVKALAISIVPCTESDAATSILLKAGDSYFYNTSSTKNGFSVSTIGNAKKYEVTISIDEDGNADITAAGSYLRYNPSNESGAIFNFYKSTTYTAQQPVQLYRLVD